LIVISTKGKFTDFFWSSSPCSS